MRYLSITQFAPVVIGSLVATSAFATQYLTQEQAQQVVFPDATSFKSQSVTLSLEQIHRVEKLAGLPVRSVAWHIFTAYKDDQVLGYLVFDDVVGKFELISYAVGFQPDAAIRQIEILTYRESHGFEIRNTAWRKQFVGKLPSKELNVGEGIANISGATMSCTHVTDGVRRIAAVLQIYLNK